jgi:acetyl-CoA acetyltransferase
LITHGESGRSGIGRTCNVVSPASLAGQFEQTYGPMGPPTLFTIPVLRYMKTYGLTHEQLAMVSVVQREWAAKNPRATFKTPITVEDVLNSRMIVYPFRLLQCCLVTDGGGAPILVAASAPATSRKACPWPRTGGRSTCSAPANLSRRRWSAKWKTSPPRVRSASPALQPFAEAGITHNDVDHLMIYDAPCSLPGASFAHPPIYGLEDLGFVPRGEAGRFVAERNTAPGVPGTAHRPTDEVRGLKSHGRPGIPLNANGGGLSYMHSGMYGMYALQESACQMRDTAPAQIPDAKISVCHGAGGMFAASGTIIMSNEAPQSS